MQRLDAFERKGGSINEKIALVTGAGSGIGRQAVLSLARAGYAVVLTGRRQETLQETADMAPQHARTLVVSADVCDPESVGALFKEIENQFGRLDVLFNNAGVNVPATPLEELPFEQWQQVIHTNLTGVFLCTQQAIQLMKRQKPRGGRIINNGSISAQAPRPDSAAYTASKHAVTGLTKSTSLDCRKYDIACGQIDIGNALTEMSSRVQEGVRQANGSIATEPVMDAGHVGDAVVFMASLPLNANIPFITVMATNMPLVGRG